MTALPRNAPRSTDVRGVRWQRSSYSTGANNCVETARPDSGPWQGMFAVRDSKEPAGPAVCFSPRSWTAFLDALR